MVPNSRLFFMKNLDEFSFKPLKIMNLNKILYVSVSFNFCRVINDEVPNYLLLFFQI